MQQGEMAVGFGYSLLSVIGLISQLLSGKVMNG